jgi:alpha-galactosidase
MFRLSLILAFVALVLVGVDGSANAAPAPSGFVGTWTAEQIPPGGAPRRQGTLVITQNGGALTGVMRLDRGEVPLANVRESDGIISFSVRAPENGVTLNYSGAIRGNQLGVASQDLGSGSYTLTGQRAGTSPPPQVAQTPAASPPAAPLTAPKGPAAAATKGPAPPPAKGPAPPPAKGPAPPPATAKGGAAATPAAPPSLGAAGSTPSGDFVGRLLGQSPSVAKAPEEPQQKSAAPAASPPSQVASAAPAQRVDPPVRPRTAPPPPPSVEPPLLSAPSIEGNWTAEQTTPDRIGRSPATLSFTRNGDRLVGVLQTGGQDLPLFDIRQAGSTVSFSVVVPGTPYETINYRGTLESGRLAVQGLGERQGAYALTAARQAAPAPEVSIASAQPPPAAAPVAPPASASASGAAPGIVVPAPAAPVTPTPVPAILHGNWIAEITNPGSNATISGALSFDADNGRLHVGQEDLPVYEVNQSGSEISFTVVVPGTPYVSVHFSGFISESTMQLSSLDGGRGVSTLSARRANEGALPAAGLAVPQQASISPPPAVVPAPRRPEPSPPSARPSTQAGPPPAPPKLPLPALRDLAPNGLALTPPMGWASRQKLGARMTDEAIRRSVAGLVESALNLLGYVHVELGDGWQGARDSQGVLHPSERFPDMKALGDYIHSQGLEFGITTSAAPKSCNGFEGSYGYEAQDARMFATWGVDYVVYDGCGTEKIYATQNEFRAAFQVMGDALRASGRDIVYVISLKGQPGVEQWAARAGANVWRTATELEENWAAVSAVGFAQTESESSVRPGAWSDPGLLQVGNSGMTADESRMQLNLWTVLAAPMMLGNDARMMMRDTVSLLSNRELIEISQDKLGRPGKRIAQTADTQVWARPLADGSVALAVFNTGKRTTSVAVNWQQLGIQGSRLVRDLWWHENLGIATDSYVVVLSAGTSMLLKLSR